MLDFAGLRAAAEDAVQPEFSDVVRRAARRRRRDRSARIGALAGAGALAVTGVVAAPAFVGDQSSSAAWAVESRADGSVKVKVRELKDPEGLERRLTQAGIRAYVTFIPAGKFCDYHSPDYPAVRSRGIVDDGPQASTREFVIYIHPDRLAPDERLALQGIAPRVTQPDGKPDNSLANKLQGFKAAVIPLDEERCQIVSRGDRIPGAGITPTPR
jgi:hypothetical protein